METASKYEVPIFLRDKKLQISTISPNGLYFYKIKTPKDLYWGLFCSPIAFYDKSGNLIYHKQMQLAQFGLSEDNPWKIVAWSSSGTIVYFIERISIDNCWRVFLDLKHKKVCRIQWEREDANLFKSFGVGNFPDSVILEGKIFEFKDFEPEKVKLTISDLFGISGWRPN